MTGTRIGPDLYRDNPFRITDLPVDASDRDIRRRTEELRIKARFGDGTWPGSPLLRLDPPPDADAVQQAFQRLRDPLPRLEDELFWFWPSHDGDEALAALGEGRVEDAERLWHDPGPGRPAAVAAHNLAVLAHARALDSGDLRDERWAHALRHWRTVLDTDAFWDLVAARARAADDPRVGADAADDLRERLAGAVLSVSALLAMRAAQAGEHAEAAAHVALMRAAGFGDAAVDAALNEAADPDTSLLRSADQSAIDRTAANAADGLDEARLLADRSEPVFAGLAAVLPPDHPVLSGLRDEIADTVKYCVVRYVNHTDDSAAAEALLERATSIAATPNVKADIAENLQIVRDNQIYETCWFCHRNRPDGRLGAGVKMYGDVQHDYSHISWHKTTITVPRCTTCASAHRTYRIKLWAYGLGSGVSLYALASVFGWVGPYPVSTVLFFLAVASIVVTAIWAATHPFSPSAKKTLHAFPPVQERLKAGWFFGQKPPSAN